MHTMPYDWRAKPLLGLVTVYRLVRCEHRHALLEMFFGHSHTLVYVGAEDDPKVVELMAADERLFAVFAGRTYRAKLDIALVTESAARAPRYLPAALN